MIPFESDPGRAIPLPSFLQPYVIGSSIVAGIAVIDSLWIATSTHSVRWTSLFPSCKAALVLLGIAIALRAIGRIPRYQAVTAKLHYARMSNTAAWCALLLLFVSATCILSYLCVSIDAPLVERWLIAFDHSLGFDWPAVYQWVLAHPRVHEVLEFAYASGQCQLVVVPVALGLFGKREELPAFFFLLVIASGYLLLISTPFPATSAFVHFNVDDIAAKATVSDFELLRAGSLQVIDLANTQGLVALPSFHTAIAALFTYSLRRIRWLVCIAAPLNMIMILSTPTQGGHYLADVIAGLVLFALTVFTYNAIVWRRSLCSNPRFLPFSRTVDLAGRERPL
ncbi:phosphatase PAP2 family protein [Paraburkholderia dilworthii]|uniref:phosphatase PAP2 family protein n=1 Tax=Paraburkholderia dilworthii TaxID=948106 RepID=UPI0006882A40|nr:phosphatase PAP2 family protein [Paraburkholderia dilworthii]